MLNGNGPALLVRRWTPGPRCVGRARRELRRNLRAWGLGEPAESAELVLSELLTNAVQHARSPRGRLVETPYERTHHGVRIEVHDANETWPVLQKPSADAESGRGLALVDVLTRTLWGVSEGEGVGKLIWALIAVDGIDESATAPDEPR